MESVLSSLGYGSRFPTQANRLSAVAKPEETNQNAIGVHPFVDARIHRLMGSFLATKRTCGSECEKKLYSGMTVEQFVTRLLCQRPLSFVQEIDWWLLKSGENGKGGFEQVGTNQERSPLVLDQVISYDEMVLSAFLGMSVPTSIINQGGRFNKGMLDESGEHVDHAVYIGSVGARFEKSGVMEYAHMLITPEQNTSDQGYGCNPSARNHMLDFWASSELYRDLLPVDGSGRPYFPTYAEAQSDQQRYAAARGVYFNTSVYKARLRAVVFPYLLEANAAAQKQGCTAFCHAVGLGLGLWAVDDVLQARIMLDVYGEALTSLELHSISDLRFSWFPKDAQRMRVPSAAGNVATVATIKENERGLLCDLLRANNDCALAYKEYADGDVCESNDNKIRVFFNNRDPFGLLYSDDKVPADGVAAAAATVTAASTGVGSAEKLIIAQYAWDSNAYPGNEFWMQELRPDKDVTTMSGDPAAASCSTIGELQNPEVNGAHVCGEKLVVYTCDGSGDGSALVAALVASAEGDSSPMAKRQNRSASPATATSTCS
jgi:hypothetical protein